jgi:hydrogenase maturation protease
VSAVVAPTLIFGWGNPSRGDDALGPLFIDHFEALVTKHPEWGEVDFLTDFQLQVEHALDLQGRSRVLFVDASIKTPAPCQLEAIVARKDSSFTTHAMSPQSVMQVYTDIEDHAPPPCWLLSIRGERFELGEALGIAAQANLVAALTLAAGWMDAA